ncbi:methylation-associated defense system AAA family ATPase MAD3 [Vibrio owensii]|uniref:methylation-associated defense system AAA family ATPase MAD3 n=1 Tax=Vibrio owensii TaxID=696485 RepID=UPI0040684BEC
MITRIEAYDYRCFKKLDLSLGAQHVFAGSNGSGKTTLLDIPALLGDLVRVNDINDAFFVPMQGRERSRAGQAIELVHKLIGDSFVLALEVRLPEKEQQSLMRNGPDVIRFGQIKPCDTARYEIAFKIEDEKIEISEEHLMVFVDQDGYRLDHGQKLQGNQQMERSLGQLSLINRSWRQPVSYQYQWEDQRRAHKLEYRLRDTQTALSALPADPDLFPIALWIQEYLLDGAFCYEPQWPAMRQAATLRDKDSFKPDGSSLAWQVLALQEHDPDGLEEWTSLVQMALPTIREIAAKQREDDGSCYLNVTYANDMKVPSSGLSHGTLHILALTIIPFLTNAPKVLTLEEPENGIHPKAIDAVLEALRLAENSQVWLSTHAPIVLANTNLEQIITMRLNVDGATEVVKGPDHPRLKHWKGEVNLGELFAAGVLE